MGVVEVVLLGLPHVIVGCSGGGGVGTVAVVLLEVEIVGKEAVHLVNIEAAVHCSHIVEIASKAENPVCQPPRDPSILKLLFELVVAL